MNTFLLTSGEDIPFTECQLIFHQPKIKELSLVGSEEELLQFWDLINFSKDKLKDKAKVNLDSISNFNIIMTIMQEDENKKIYFENILYLLVPDAKAIHFMPNAILIIKANEGMEDTLHNINEENFESFKEIINYIFDISQIKKEEIEYDPANETARKIAEKIKRGREKIAAQKKADNNGPTEIFGRYIRILSVGMNIDFRIFLEYTVYQLFTVFKTFEKKYAYDIYLKAQLAGASGMKEVKHWME